LGAVARERAGQLIGRGASPGEARDSTSDVKSELIGGRYQLERLMGHAASARVYRARDSVLGRTVVLKLFRAGDDPESAERFRAEARSAARLVHANLLTVIDRGEEEGRDYVVFEYLGGETLRDRLRREGPLPVREAIGLGVQLASALAFVAEREGVQREVQPESVLLGEAGQVKLADFGIALDGSPEEDTLPHPQEDAPAAAAPPQATEPASDGVRSLGALLYELVAGFPPAGPEDIALLEERRPDCPERLRAAIERALGGRDMETSAETFASIQELGRELELCRSELERSERRTRVHPAATGVIQVAAPPEPELAPAPSLLEPALSPLPPLEPGRRSRRRLGLAAVPVVLLAAAGGAVAYEVLGRSDKTSSRTTTAGAPAVHLRAVSAYDPPPGDGQEDNARLALASDGKLSTAWVTERYNTQHFGNLKSGVGLVVEASHPVKLRSLVVRTDTPDFSAMVKAGMSRAGPFRTVARAKTVRSSTTFVLDASREARYYVLWITNLSPGTGPRYYVDVNEISAG
jgi:serine/threonine protein kinase